MFQYAVGRTLSLKNNTELKLDISAFDSYRLHEYSLEKLSIAKNYATKKDLPWYENASVIALQKNQRNTKNGLPTSIQRWQVLILVLR